MTKPSGGNAPPKETCRHLIKSGFDKPFALLKSSSQYACMACVADYITMMMDLGYQPWHITNSVNFRRCTEKLGYQLCLSALESKLKALWKRKRDSTKRKRRRYFLDYLRDVVFLSYYGECAMPVESSPKVPPKLSDFLARHPTISKRLAANIIASRPMLPIVILDHIPDR